jgi:hypothetical protein
MNTIGVQEYSWGAHVSVCKRCQEVTLTSPATLAKACLEGSRLVKAALVEINGRRRRELDDLAMGGGAR